MYVHTIQSTNDRRRLAKWRNVGFRTVVQFVDASSSATDSVGGNVFFFLHRTPIFRRSQKCCLVSVQTPAPSFFTERNGHFMHELRTSCDQCSERKRKCNGERPCMSCCRSCAYRPNKSEVVVPNSIPQYREILVRWLHTAAHRKEENLHMHI